MISKEEINGLKQLEQQLDENGLPVLAFWELPDGSLGIYGSGYPDSTLDKIIRVCQGIKMQRLGDLFG